MKSPLLAPQAHIARGLKPLLVAAVALFAVTTSSNAITINWNGTNNFNDSYITFAPFQANQLTDIYGSGLYEACCGTGLTNFTLKLKLNGSWTEVLSWTSSGDHTQHTLGDLVPPVINFGLSWVSGIKLNSNPNGHPSGYDFNFVGFNYVTHLSKYEYYNLYKHKYKDWDDFDRCGDYEDYVRHQTSFVFCTNCTPPPEGPPPDPTPLPAAFPLFATGVGALGLLGWRKRRAKKAAS